MTPLQLIVVLVRARRERRLSLRGLAERLGRAPNSVYRWEGGYCSPSLDAFAAWAAALGYRLALIPYEHGAETPQRSATEPEGDTLPREAAS